VFPEIDPDKVTFVQGMDVTFVTSTRKDSEARDLLREFGMPFQKLPGEEDGAAGAKQA
jgi:large subunit ribosomal protein L5